MEIQSEAILERNLISQLSGMGYERIDIKDEAELNSNFKKQLEKHNRMSFSDKEFNKILLHLEGGSIFEKSKKLRDSYLLETDMGEKKLISFINSKDWCHNIFQVSNQITMKDKYENRYDVTILINGLPLVQIELKRRGIELKQAFHQICRYHRHSFKGLFSYLQIFVISNGVNSRYFSNNRELTFQQTFYWTDEENNRYSNLEQFAENFLEKCHLAKMITKYIVLNETQKILMILRPYQYFAVERIVKRVENNPSKNGYIWHTTGSGKTLTSFKASQILTSNDKIDKVIFCVDRKDLDYQTVKEFNAFSKGSVDGAENTGHLISQLTDSKTPLIITTIQKLNNAISKPSYVKQMESAKDKRICFIFDECHRSQFGDTHDRIKKFFTDKQFFGFTGTPIFAENSVKTNTTAELFDECLHKYVIKDAIDDENVLGFSVEYYSTFKSKKLRDEEGNDLDVDSLKSVEGIDTKEVFSAPARLEGIADFILENHHRKTYQKEFQSIFAISDIKTLIEYYKIFKKKDHNLKIAAIFTYGANEDLTNDEGTFEVEGENSPPHSREVLDEIVTDYNKMFGSNFDLNKDNGFNAYFIDISKNVKEKKIDILLVVNMFLTGFDSKYLNTLYVDKNLRYHGLIQAFSRTNRILNEKKRYGNIVSFRNLKKRTDEAITLFSNKDAVETVLMKSYEEYLAEFNRYVEALLKVVPTVDSVDTLETEEKKAEFVEKYRNLLRVMNRLSTFSEFDYEHLDIDAQSFEDYRSKYLDIYDSVTKRTEKEKVSILDDLDFEVELVRRDEVNVSYILSLLKDLDPSEESFARDKAFILKLMNGSPELRNKVDLINKFITENLPELEKSRDVEEAFSEFLDIEKAREIDELVEEQKLKKHELAEAISEFEYSEKFPRELVLGSFEVKPKLTERKPKLAFLQDKMKEIINRYLW